MSWTGRYGEELQHQDEDTSATWKQTGVKYIIVLHSNSFLCLTGVLEPIKYYLMSLSDVLEPMEYSQKVQTPPSGPLAQLYQARSQQKYLNPKQLRTWPRSAQESKVWVSEWGLYCGPLESGFSRVPASIQRRPGSKTSLFCIQILICARLIWPGATEPTKRTRRRGLHFLRVFHWFRYIRQARERVYMNLNGKPLANLTQVWFGGKLRSGGVGEGFSPRSTQLAKHR